MLAIELKYFTRRLRITHDGEAYDLVDQSEADIGRYQFLKDIGRVETIVHGYPGVRGAVIALTNNLGYWRQPGAVPVTIDADSRIHEGRVAQGSMAWGALAGAGTMKGIERPIDLRGAYPMGWRDYSNIGPSPGELFRYLLVSLPAQPAASTLR